MRTEITWENLEVGDILKSKYGGKAKILGICGLVYFLSEIDNFECNRGGYTKQEIETMLEFTIVQPEPIDEEAPFEPEDGEEFYYPDTDYENMYNYCNFLENYAVHIIKKERGLCFRTPQGAIKCAEKMLNALK